MHIKSATWLFRDTLCRLLCQLLLTLLFWNHVGWSLNNRAFFVKVNLNLYIITIILRSFDLILQCLNKRCLKQLNLLRGLFIIASCSIIFASSLDFGYNYFYSTHKPRNPNTCAIMIFIRISFIGIPLYKFLTICSFILTELFSTGYIRMELFETLGFCDNSTPTFSLADHQKTLRE